MEDGSGAVGLQLVCTQRSERTGAPQYCYLCLYICARTLGPGSMVKKSEAVVVPTSSGFSTGTLMQNSECGWCSSLMLGYFLSLGILAYLMPIQKTGSSNEVFLAVTNV